MFEGGEVITLAKDFYGTTKQMDANTISATGAVRRHRVDSMASERAEDR